MHLAFEWFVFQDKRTDLQKDYQDEAVNFVVLKCSPINALEKDGTCYFSVSFTVIV